MAGPNLFYDTAPIARLYNVAVLQIEMSAVVERHQLEFIFVASQSLASSHRRYSCHESTAPSALCEQRISLDLLPAPARHQYSTALSNIATQFCSASVG